MKGLIRLRLALFGTLVLATFLAAQVVGVAAATNYQQTESRNAQAAIASAATAFDAEVKRVLGDGTSKAAIDPIVAQEKKLQGQAPPAAGYFLDRGRLDALHQHRAELDRLTLLVAATETQAEVQMHQQLLDALQKLRDLLPPARGAGLDPTPYSQFADDTEKTNQGLLTPAATQKVIDAVTAKASELRALTDQQVAANEALRTAKNDASSALSSAQAALAQARTIPVLKVDAAAAAIAAGADRLAHAATVADYQGAASVLWAQNSALRTLLSTRQSAYDLLATTRDHLARAKAANKDVANDEASLAPAAAALDAAYDLPTIQAAQAQIQAVKNDVDAKYWLAVYGTGKVIIVSIARQELMALQDGVVALDTVVTTGRPALPTITGTFHIFRKYSPYCMSSSWPPSSPYYWAGCAKMDWAMEFEASGYFIHDAPWRSRYGPGTNDSNGTHGCVNVPHNAMSWLYPWTDMGTTVVVLQGDFGS
jgi:lipoprotein-anchoring transpeptidase ErfK/SrfK